MTKTIYADASFVIQETDEGPGRAPRLRLMVCTDTLAPFTPEEATKVLAQMSLAIMQRFRKTAAE